MTVDMGKLSRDEHMVVWRGVMGSFLWARTLRKTLNLTPSKEVTNVGKRRLDISTNGQRGRAFSRKLNEPNRGLRQPIKIMGVSRRMLSRMRKVTVILYRDIWQEPVLYPT